MKYLKIYPNVFSIADDIFVGYDVDGKDHGDTLKSTTDMPTGISETKHTNAISDEHLSHSAVKSYLAMVWNQTNKRWNQIDSFKVFQNISTLAVSNLSWQQKFMYTG